jgi:hypothetical protein
MQEGKITFETYERQLAEQTRKAQEKMMEAKFDRMFKEAQQRNGVH